MGDENAVASAVELLEASATTALSAVPTPQRPASTGSSAVSEARSKLAYLLAPPPIENPPPAASKPSVAPKEERSPAAQESSAARRERVTQQPSGQCEEEPVLGITSSRCGGCGRAEGTRRRAFVELGALYCDKCWLQWERCGWWRPTIRINSYEPRKGPNGIPEYGPEDAFMIPGFFGADGDMTWFHRLSSELPEGKDFCDWNGGRHLGCQFEGEGARHKESPSALRAAVQMLEEAFGIEASASRLNMYRDFGDFKTMHHDRGQDKNGVPQVTVGASFGATRELTFLHPQTGLTQSFPQRNGDVFAFTPELNMVFMHGIPKVPQAEIDRVPASDQRRLSLILWGSRVKPRCS